MPSAVYGTSTERLSSKTRLLLRRHPAPATVTMIFGTGLRHGPHRNGDPHLDRATIGACGGTSADARSPSSMNHRPSNPSWWQRGTSAVLRVVLLLFAAVVMIGTLLLSLLLACGVLLWALLRGRRSAPVNLRWARMPRPAGFGHPRAGDSAGEVVDVQVREVRGPTLR